MRSRTKLAGAAAALLVGVGLTGQEPGPPAAPAAAAKLPSDSPTAATAPSATAVVAATPSPAPAAVAVRPADPAPEPPADDDGLRQDAGDGDGDSWSDTTGRRYRLGLVDAPEVGTCFGSEATAERRRLTAAGFRAEVYTDDRYGRGVSAVTTADGLDLNVHLARRGFVDDRYLAQFRDENPTLARRLDTAFAQAKADRAGLWGACRGAAPAPQPVAAAPAAGCHPDYATCVPVKGDGSGRGAANDLDCPDVGQRVLLRQRGVDPYRLDRQGDGVGCEGYA